MKIQITQQHIDDAIRWRDSMKDDPWKEVTRNCPVARALQEVFPGEAISVGIGTAYFPRTLRWMKLGHAGIEITNVPFYKWEFLRPTVIEVVEDV